MLIASVHAAAPHPPSVADHVTTVSILAAFVAINTMFYVGLALIRMTPRIRLGLRRRYVRAETRSIHPAAGLVAPARRRSS